MSGITGEAAVLVGPGRMEVREFTVPEPADGELLVRTRAAAICGSDLHRVFGRSAAQGDTIDHPYPCPPGYPGHEGIGEVVTSRSADFQVGQSVLTLPEPGLARTFAGYQVISARAVLPVRSGHDPVHTLMAQQLGTVVFALKRFWPEQTGGDTAVVVGAGSTGLFFVRMLRHLGFDRIIVSDLEPTRLAAARTAGADVTVLAPGERVDEVTMDVTNGRGAVLAVDASGTDVGRRSAMVSAGAGGRVGLFGLPEGEDLVVPFGTLFRRQVSLIPVVGAQSEPGLASFAAALRLIERGEIEVSGQVTHTFDIKEITKALHLAHERGDGVIKVAVTFD